MNISKIVLHKIFLAVGFVVFSLPLQASVESCLFPLPNSKAVEEVAIELAKNEPKNISAALINALSETSNGSQNVGSSLLSFISDLKLSGLVLNEEDGGEPLTLTHNLKLFGDANNSKQDHNSMIQLRVFRDAMVSSDLSELLGEEITTSLQSQLDEFDDIELEFSYSWTNKSAGRLFQNYSNNFSDLISSRLSAITDDRDSARANLYDELEKANYDNCEKPFSSSTAASESALNEAYAKAQSTQSLVTNAYREFTSTYQPTKYAALVSNQPQLIFSGSYRNRNDLVGADELGIKVSYEFGLYNINGLRKFQEKRKSNGVSPYEAYAQYIARNNPILRDDRFAFSLEYSDVDDFDFDDGNSQLFNAGGEKVAVSASYGRTLSVKNEKAILRFDAGLEAIEFLGDTEGVDRLVSSATFTYRIDDRLSIPFTIEYANRSEFLSDESSTFGANIGFKYDFNFSQSN